MNIQGLVIILILIIPVLTTAILFIFKNWIVNKIQYSIKSEYDRQLEEFKNSISTKSKASLVADLLSEWISKPNDRKLLNKLTFEAFLWLPKDIAIDLSDLLSHKPSSKSVRDIIAAVRNHLLVEGQSIESHNIIVFSPKSENQTQE